MIDIPPSDGTPPKPPKTIKVRYEDVHEMLELLREIEADCTCGDWREAIRALLARIGVQNG